MAKTIKFNLICDGNPVRTIEDLRNNFSIEDVLDYYDNKLLHRWLSVREYQSELKAVSRINSADPMKIIKELIRIFDVAADEKKVEEAIYILKYRNERRDFLDIYKQEKYNVDHIIDDYKTGYLRLVNGIIENPDDAAKIKANIAEMASHYPWILELNRRDLFWTLMNRSKLAVMCLLMNEKSRNYYLPVEIPTGDNTAVLDTLYNTDKKRMFDAICLLLRGNNLADDLGDNLLTFSGMTDGYWKDLEPKGKQFMIVSMESGDYVRSAGRTGGDLAYDDINQKFVIVDGIDYKSKSNINKLRYMEV